MSMKVFKVLRCCLVLLAVVTASHPERLLAGPLAEAVARAKAAAGVPVDPEPEPAQAVKRPPAPEPAAAAIEQVGDQPPAPAMPPTVTLASIRRISISWCGGA